MLFCPSLFSSVKLAIQQHVIPGIDDPVAVHIQQLLIAVAAGLGIQAVQESDRARVYPTTAGAGDGGHAIGAKGGNCIVVIVRVQGVHLFIRRDVLQRVAPTGQRLTLGKAKSVGATAVWPLFTATAERSTFLVSSP